MSSDSDDSIIDLTEIGDSPKPPTTSTSRATRRSARLERQEAKPKAVRHVTPTPEDDEDEKAMATQLKSEDGAGIQEDTIDESVAAIAAKPRPSRPSASTVSSYLRSLRRGVQTRKFDLSKLPTKEEIPTGRTVRKSSTSRSSGNHQHWPAIREFLQNTVDHLQLLDQRTGRLHDALRLKCRMGRKEKGPDDDESLLAEFRFVCLMAGTNRKESDDEEEEEEICTIRAYPNKLEIIQRYTFPLHPRALDTGVIDENKRGDDSAGGFGDGFKTAALALLALGSECKSIQWTFQTPDAGTTLHWYFEAVRRDAVASFRQSRNMIVRIEKETSAGERSTKSQKANNREADHVMTQLIQVRGIGTSFVKHAVPRLQVFWDLPERTTPTLLMCRGTGDCIGHVASTSRTTVAQGVLGSSIRPDAGIYVRGIWVRSPKITGTFMSFFGNRLNVSGRDRNDVDEEELLDAVSYVLRHCSDAGSHLRQLLDPLRGRSSQVGASTSSSSGSSWLLKSPQFLNMVLEQNSDFILYDVLGIPQGAIFVSNRSRKGEDKDPFWRWASEYLKQRGAPLYPIETGANRILFRPIDPFELAERCVRELLTSMKKKKKEKSALDAMLQSAFRKIMTFMGLRNVNIHFSSDVGVAFVHRRSVFVPEVPLTRELIIKVLNVCQCHMDGADGERFSSLVQATFETLPASSASTSNGVGAGDVDITIQRAKAIQQENSKFLMQPAPNTKPALEKAVLPANEPIDLTESSSGTTSNSQKSRKRSFDSDGAGKKECCKRKHTSRTTTGNSIEGGAFYDLNDTIKKVMGTQRSDGTPENEDNRIIPETHFPDNDQSGQDSCLRPSSKLILVEVDDSLGGGSVLCDALTARSILTSWDTASKAKLKALRESLREAISTVQQCVPTLNGLLRRIRDGYDAANNDYEAFCDGTRIVVNLHTYMPRMGRAESTTTLVHDLVVTVTHELAHFLEPAAGHGVLWRNAHMAMITQIMAKLTCSSAR